MKLIHKLFLGLIGLVFFTSCSDLNENITLDKKGKGTYSMSTDVGGLMEMMGGMMQNQENPVEQMFGAKPDQWDTTIVMFDALKQSDKDKMEEPELYKKVKFDIDADKLRSKFAIMLNVDFDNQEELNKILAQMNSVGENAKQNPGQILGGLTGGKVNWSYDGKTFTRDVMPMNLMDQMSGASGMPTPKPEELNMAKMMMGPAVYRSTIELPKEIKTVEGEGWSSEGKTLIYEIPLMELVDAKELPGVTATH